MPPAKPTPRRSTTRKTTAAKATVAQRQVRAATALQMRLRGKTTAEIAKALKITAPTAGADIDWYLEEILAVPARKRVAEHLALIQDTRSSTIQLRDDLLSYLANHLEYMRRWEVGEPPRDDDGNELPMPELDNNAIGKVTALNDSLLKTMDHEAKLIGLYAPTKVHVTALDENFAETAAKILGDLNAQGAIKAKAPTVKVIEAGEADVMEAEVVSVMDEPAPDDWING